MIGPDGHGYYRTDANGKRVYVSDAQMEREEQQERADKSRAETLYVSDEYKVFFLTKQPNAAAGDDRKAYISVKPFNSLPPGAVDEMKTSAEPWTAAATSIRIEAKDPLVIFHDDITTTQSSIYIGELDADVQQRLHGGKEAEQAWGKYFNAAAAPGTSAVAITDTISVHKPLAFRQKAVL